MKKRFSAALLAALLTLTLAGCGRDKLKLPTEQTGGEDFQRNMHQSVSPVIDTMCETEEGIYFMGPHYRAYYLDKTAKRATILCGKPECDHQDESCGADLGAYAMWFYENRLYFASADYVHEDGVMENGGYVNYGERVYSVGPDGTGRRVVQDLEFVPSGDKVNAANPILHRGVVYFSYDGDLYALPLGGDIRDAEKLWSQELPEVETDGHGIPVVGARTLSYDLWADGDTLYFMTALELSDGTWRDTLFTCDINTKEIRQVWQTPSAAEVGTWDTAGVSPTRWYILDGVLYFYLSGNGLWRTDLSSGETAKLADTSQIAPHGTAVFSDDCLCVLNDGLESHELFSYSDFTDHAGGDTLTVYGLDGTLRAEISLKSLYEEFDPLNHVQLICCTGNDVYFLVDATGRGTLGESSQVGDAMGSEMKYVRQYILCSVSISTGKLTKIDAWKW